jgi:hypothetical protein
LTVQIGVTGKLKGFCHENYRKFEFFIVLEQLVSALVR